MKPILSTLAILSCTAAWADPPKVAVDIAPVHGLVSQVMDGVATPDLVIAQGASPHGYAMRPSEARALAQADVVFWIGPLLTPWMSDPIETLAGDALHVELASVEGVARLEVRSSARFEAHDHDHGHEEHADDDHDDHAHADEHDHGHEEAKHDDHADDDHAHADEHDHDHDHGHDEAKHDDHDDHAHGAEAIDGHMWLDPETASVWLAEIARVLSEKDPENAEIYQSNATAGQAQIASVSAEIETLLAPVRDAPFIVFHDSYQYFEQRFGVTAVASLTLSDDSPASAARMAEVREVIAETGATCALAELRASQGLLDAVSEGAEITVMRTDALGVDIPTGPQFYPALLAQIGDRIVTCLSGNS